MASCYVGALFQYKANWIIRIMLRSKAMLIWERSITSLDSKKTVAVLAIVPQNIRKKVANARWPVDLALKFCKI